MANVADLLLPFSFFSDDDNDNEPYSPSLDSILPPFALSSPPFDPDLFSTNYCPSFFSSGLRVAGSDSDSDSASCVSDIDPPAAEPLCPDCLRFDDASGDGRTENGDFDWEEVNNRLDLLAMMVGEGGADDLSFDGDPSVGVGGGDGGVVSWEVLLDENSFQVEDGDLFVEDDEFMLGEFYPFSAPRTGLPTARLVVKTLPTVVVSREWVVDCGGVGCAVCMEEFGVEEEVKMLPCKHCYHGECILPWLEMKNTCPVCRYELPTDETEDKCGRARRSEEEVRNRVRYEFEFPLAGFEY